MKIELKIAVEKDKDRTYIVNMSKYESIHSLIIHQK